MKLNIHDVNSNDLYILCIELNSICQGKPRPNIVWYKDGRELYGHRYLHVSKSLVVRFSIHHNSIIRQTLSRKHIFQIRQFWRGKHRIKSKMEIDPATQGDAGIYECHANNK